MTDRKSFGATTTADEVLEGIDLTGKTVLITGGASGLGEETARALAARGAHITITARSRKKGEPVAAQIRQSTGNSNIDVEELELGSLASIRGFAGHYLRNHDSLNILINNAGVMACPLSRTEDGFELQLGTNYLGHFFMTNLIMPALLKGSPGRVVNLSSVAHKVSPVLFDDPNFDTTEYNSWQSYGQSKTAAALFSVELTRRSSSKGLESFSVHPGVIQTPLMRHMSQDEIESLESSVRNHGKGDEEIKTVQAGAATSCYAATAPEIAGNGGGYLADCTIQQVSDDPDVVDGVRSYAVDFELAERLWAVSEEMVGQSFPD